MINKLKDIVKTMLAFAKGMQQALVEQSVETLELELLELQHAFLSIVVGSLAGLPLAPIGLAAELAPLLEDEMKILFERTWRGGDAISDLFSRMGGEW
ncbi:MAG: hypothetical protein DSY37_04135 [Hyperthermus sp.]|nr:MAG: hypothetical protein DSY37_04135 [Hyperthermus sp.]